MNRSHLVKTIFFFLLFVFMITNYVMVFSKQKGHKITMTPIVKKVKLKPCLELWFQSNLYLRDSGEYKLYIYNYCSSTIQIMQRLKLILPSNKDYELIVPTSIPSQKFTLDLRQARIKTRGKLHIATLTTSFRNRKGLRISDIKWRLEK